MVSENGRFSESLLTKKKIQLSTAEGSLKLVPDIELKGEFGGLSICPRDLITLTFEPNAMKLRI
jgi:hypothetical protein